MSRKRPAESMAGRVAFVGLGAMGYHMAGHLAKRHPGRCRVWNRSAEKARRHSEEFGSNAATSLAELSDSQVVVFCLPTSKEDEAIVEQVAPHLARDSCVVSCTSGEPGVTIRLATSLRDRFGVHFLDCPVSGGPKGAAAGSLTCMLGSDSDDAAESVMPFLDSFAKKVVRCGPAGAGHAVKAVNNALNVTHLLLGAEGLLALQRLGVDPQVALEAINGSSGRSLQTEQRLPQEVLTRRFGYGFKLPLMAKDCRIASEVLKEHCPTAQILPLSTRLVQQFATEHSPEADYTFVVRSVEKSAGLEIQSREGAAAGPE
eukprot:s2473_g2.t1